MSPVAAEVGGWQLFAGMVPGDVEVVLSACERRVLAPGELIAAEGDAGDALVIVCDGEVEIFKAIARDVDRVVSVLQPGDVIGAMSFLDGSRYPAGARATRAGELAVLARAAFERVRMERPDVAAPFYRNLACVLADHLRTALENYRESVRYAIEATGATGLSLTHLVDELRPTTVHLSGGATLTGRLLQLDQNPAGHTLVLKDAGGTLSIVPYHAIVRIVVG